MGTTPCSSATVAAPPFDFAVPLRTLAARVADWLAAHRQAAADGDLLANLSERELLDIGMPVNATPNARDAWWPADYPR